MFWDSNSIAMELICHYLNVFLFLWFIMGMSANTYPLQGFVWPYENDFVNELVQNGIVGLQKLISNYRAKNDEKPHSTFYYRLHRLHRKHSPTIAHVRHMHKRTVNENGYWANSIRLQRSESTGLVEREMEALNGLKPKKLKTQVLRRRFLQKLSSKT